jgi:hypothetical protein
MSKVLVDFLKDLSQEHRTESQLEKESRFTGNPSDCSYDAYYAGIAATEAAIALVARRILHTHLTESEGDTNGIVAKESNIGTSEDGSEYVATERECDAEYFVGCAICGIDSWCNGGGCLTQNCPNCPLPF